MLSIFDDDPAARALLDEALEAPSVYDEFLRYLARHGHDVPVEMLQRDVTLPYRFNADLVPVFVKIYEHAEQHWEAYEACEELVDLEENFQLWRFRHLKTVERTIGVQARHRRVQRGRRSCAAALDLTFFPELYAVRTEIGVPRVTDELLDPRRGAGRRRPAGAAAGSGSSPRTTSTWWRTWTATRWAGRCAATAELLDEFVREQWAGRLIRGWTDGWLELAAAARRPARRGGPRRRAGPDGGRRLHHGAALQAGPGRGRRPARAAARSCWTPTTSPPTGTCWRASPPSAA